MIRLGNMSRRLFVRSLAAVMGIFFVRPSRLFGDTEPAAGLSIEARAEKLAKIFTNRNSAAEVGRYYLDATPVRPDLSELVQSLSSPKKGDILSHLRLKIREDFATSRTVSVDGWCLSRTEADLCAVAALAAGRA